MCYYGKGGFTHSEVYSMPVWLRRFYLKQIQKTHAEEQKRNDDATKKDSPHTKPSWAK